MYPLPCDANGWERRLELARYLLIHANERGDFISRQFGRGAYLNRSLQFHFLPRKENLDENRRYRARRRFYRVIKFITRY